LFANEASREFAMWIQADVYWFADRIGPVDNEFAAAGYESAATRASTVLVAGVTPHPLGDYLVALCDESPRYAKLASEHRVDAALRKKSLLRLSSFCHRHGSGTSTSYVDELRTYYGELDFEADFDYTPVEELADHAVGAWLRQHLPPDEGGAPDDGGSARASGLVLPD